MRRYFGFTLNMFGDLYMNVVAARCLKRADPGCHLTFGIGADFRECAPLFLDNPWIDRVHITHKGRDGFDETDLKWIAAQRFDHVFSPMQDHPPGQPWHEKHVQSLEAAHMHGLPTTGDSGKIEMTRWFKPTAGLEDCVAISPWPSFHEGTRNPKCIVPEQAQAIADHILSLGLRVLQIGGPTEPKLEGAIKLDTDYFTSVRNVLGCKAMVMGDSGLNWLLSGYGFPVLGLYSERHFGQFVHNIQPINPRAIYLTGKKVPDIGLDKIAKSLTLLL
jgi:ADP-heptose:LPS heptosyltransferase